MELMVPLPQSIHEAYDRYAALVPLPAAQGLSEREKEDILEPYFESDREAMVEMRAYYEREHAGRRRILPWYRIRENWQIVRVEVDWFKIAITLLGMYKRAAVRVRARMVQVLHGPGLSVREAAHKRRRLA